MPGKQPFFRSKTFMFSIAMLISLGCLWYAFAPLIRNADARAEFINAFKTADYRSLPIIWGTLFVFYILKAWRWRLMLIPVGSFRTVKDLLPPIMIGFSFNNILPFRMGEVARCLVFSKQHKLPVPVVVSSIVLERFFDLIGVLFFFGIGLVTIRGVDPNIQKTAMVGAAAAVVGVIGGIAYVLWTKPVLNLIERILKSIPLLPHKLTDKICSILEAGATGLSSIRNVRLLMFMLIVSLVKWGLNGLLVWLSLWSFNIDVPVTVAMLLLGVIAFGVAVPSAPGYFGVMQLCFTVVLGLFLKGEDDRAAILASSIYFQMTQWIPVTLAGLIYFAISGLNLHEVEQEQTVLEEEGAPLSELPDVSA